MENKYDISIGYDYGCEEDHYPNPETDWFVMIRIPQQKNWVDTQTLADGIREIIEKTLEKDIELQRLTEVKS